MEPFLFKTERRLVRLTGRKARDLYELASHLREVSGASVFYHTHHLYLSHHFERPAFYNEFALWVHTAMRDRILAERLASIDLLAFTTIRGLRDEISRTIEEHLVSTPNGGASCPPGEEFHFCESQSFIMPTGLVAHDVDEFFEQVPKLTHPSLYFHFMEARLRLGRRTNDFSLWLHDSGHPIFAAKIDALNPYTMTLDRLKQRIVLIGRRRRNRRPDHESR